MKNKGNCGFSITETVIAMFVLACFFIPLLRHFTSVRRMSLAARDSVMANSLLLTLMGRLQTLDFDELTDEHSTAREIEDNIHTMGKVEYKIHVDIVPGNDGRIKIIDLTAEFRVPGVAKEHGTRTLNMKSFVFR